MIPTIINKITSDWIDVKNMCRTTVNKGDSDVPASAEFKQKLLLSEHSPIRLLKVSWKWTLKSWVATHFARHHIGWERWIGTQRDDRKSIDRDIATVETRDSARQDTLVTMATDANAQALINVSRLRLCYCAQNETREHMESLKHTLSNFEPELAKVMQKNCVYRCGCPEFVPCGYWEAFVRRNQGINLGNIMERYEAADKEFYQ